MQVIIVIVFFISSFNLIIHLIYSSLEGYLHPGILIQSLVMQPWFDDELTISARGVDFHVLYSPPRESKSVIVFHHGVGACAMSFALLSREIRARTNLGVLAYDMRHHGYTTTEQDLNLDLNTLADDCIAVISSALEPDTSIILAGHSMGSAVVSLVAAERKVKGVRGVVMMEAVEQYARNSLTMMPSLLATWPKSFSSLDEATAWYTGRGHQLSNRESAVISIPPLLKQRDDGRWVWKLDLMRTQPFWESWFTGLDSNFLGSPEAKMLILAGTGRLDKELMIGQMQGKYQLIVFNDSGHYIQEDQPWKVAVALKDFWDRIGHPVPVVPKFGKFRTD